MKIFVLEWNIFVLFIYVMGKLYQPYPEFTPNDDLSREIPLKCPFNSGVYRTYRYVLYEFWARFYLSTVFVEVEESLLYRMLAVLQNRLYVDAFLMH